MKSVPWLINKSNTNIIWPKMKVCK